MFEKTFRELMFYDETIDETHVKKFIKILLDRGMPIFGIINLGWIFSFSPLMIIKVKNNSLKFLIEENKYVIKKKSQLFPFRMGSGQHLKVGRKVPIVPLIVGDNVLDFIFRGEFEEIRFRIIRLLGKHIVIGSAYKGGSIIGSLFISLNAHKFLSIDFSKYPQLYFDKVEPLPKSYVISSKIPILVNEDSSVGVDAFDPIQHTLIIGESGTGKSKFLLMLLKTIYDHYSSYAPTSVILDMHGEFKEKIHNEEKFVVDFKDYYIDPFELGDEYNPITAQLITQVIVSSIGKNNKYIERIVFFAVHLLASQGKLTLQNLHDLLVDETKRMEFTVSCELEEAKNFFDQEYQDIYIRHFNDAVLPIVNFISEYQLYVKEGKNMLSIRELVEKYKVVVISLEVNKFSKKILRFIGASIINQMYILAIRKRLQNKTLLVIDEVSLVVTETLKNILAETRKFNLFLIIATQYLGQLPVDIINAILGNVKNVFAFKLHKKDAELLAGMMDIKFEEYFIKRYSPSALEIKKKELFVGLEKREVVARIFDGEKYLPPLILKTVDMQKVGIKD